MPFPIPKEEKKRGIQRCCLTPSPSRVQFPSKQKQPSETKANHDGEKSDGEESVLLVFQNDVEGVDDAGDVL